ncbi:MAG: hypothetical protein RMN25_10340 [Anaerolineae bacterium]|nr:hypothetical protein [Thermoflexales bacterium]MDW8408165.1 hypothetical protein [Anaerolineae bacterium]
MLPDNLRLRDHPSPIPVTVAQPDMLEKPTDLWSALDNEVRPALGCMLTIALNPYAPASH